MLKKLREEASDSSARSSESEEENTVEISIEDGKPLPRQFVPCRRPKRIEGEYNAVDDEVTYIELAVVGEQAVGKTSTMMRVYKRRFEPSAQTTIGTEFVSIWMMSNAEQRYNRKTLVTVVDCAGSERYRNIVPQKLRSPFGIFFMFDATERSTFNALTDWEDVIGKNNEHACRMLVANKMDLYKKLPPEQRWMDKLNWEEECERLECDEGFYCISAFDGENVDSMFVEMVDYAIERQIELEQEADAKPTVRKKASPVVNIKNNITVSQNKNTCKCYLSCNVCRLRRRSGLRGLTTSSGNGALKDVRSSVGTGVDSSRGVDAALTGSAIRAAITRSISACAEVILSRSATISSL